MAEKVHKEKFYNDSRKLGLAIYGFLLDEHSNDRYTEEAKLNIFRAADCIQKIYKFRFADQAVLKMMCPLQNIFVIAQHPIPIKNRIAADSHKRQGNNFLETKMFKLAEVEYTKAIQLDPGNAICYCNRAVSRIGQRSFVDAIKDCEKALQIDKNYAKAYCWLGLSHFLMGNPALAVRYYRKSIKIEPNNRIFIANMELFWKKLDQNTLKVFEPLLSFSSRMITIATNATNNQVSCQKVSGGDYVDANEDNKERNVKTEIVEADEKIKAAMFLIEK